MKKGTLKRIISVLVIALFMVSFAGVAISKDTEETATITATIVSVDAGSHAVVVKDDAGKMVTLTAGSDIDITKLSTGNKATFVYGSDMVIKSVTK